jgi:3-oxoadipate enol-lactonase
MPYIEANGITIRYRVTGSGPPILILRGLVRSMDFWLDFEPALRRHFTVITHDNRGIGGTSAPWGLYSTAAMADDSAALLRAIGFDKVHVLGISLGGMIAQEIVLRHPDLVERLTLGCTRPGGGHGSRPAPGALARLVSCAFLPDEQANRRSMPILLSEGFMEAHPEIEPKWLELIRRWPIPRRVFIAQVAAAAKHRAGDRLRAVTAPTLVLCGDADKLIPPGNSEAIAGLIPGARLEWLKGSGHDFPTEQPQEVARLVEDFAAEG